MRPVIIRQPPPAGDSIKKSMSNIIFMELKKILVQWKNGPSQIGRMYPLPVFDEHDIVQLCSEVKDILRIQPAVIQRKPGVIIVGDLHGNFLNFLQIFAIHGLPPNQNYIFLGNYINYGEFSLEVVIYLFSLYYLFPSNISLLRGSTEFYPSKGPRSLSSNIDTTYGPNSILKSVFLETFTYLPIACLIGNSVLCSRSSLVSRYSNLQEIFHETLPIPCVVDQSHLFLSGLANVIPSEEVLEEFLATNNLNFLIFGGKNAGDGVENMLDDRCYALASDAHMGYCGIINLVGNQPPFAIIFTPDSDLLRENAQMLRVRPMSNQKVRPTICSIVPDRKQPLPAAQIKRNVSRLPSLSPQPLNLEPKRIMI
ncbi:phosphoprotein phosphatase protein [Trichomonas vaginalis G3]|uniref:phosphoprotein phosphatase protein n=1 Tax=Trichomonas vaginalis (strain ATCC PRA-98 / G3) TaxID=412133 RepID=UPI0021E576D8|nr:phosphoprotein phosphatase protein [Trichomonas vaginalis G3]KAI5533175.1 phosphoprotein phosphatase protein [Trichomonas vaginalis G3]